MSHPLRRIAVDPETPIRTIAELLTHLGDAIELRIGDRVFVIQRRDDEITEPDFESIDRPRNATDRLLAAAGGWKGLVDGAALKRYICEGRELDAEVERKRPLRTF